MHHNETGHNSEWRAPTMTKVRDLQETAEMHLAEIERKPGSPSIPARIAALRKIITMLGKRSPA